MSSPQSGVHGLMKAAGAQDVTAGGVDAHVPRDRAIALQPMRGGRWQEHISRALPGVGPSPTGVSQPLRRLQHWPKARLTGGDESGVPHQIVRNGQGAHKPRAALRMMAELVQKGATQG
jgi:hypothetical protein